MKNILISALTLIILNIRGVWAVDGITKFLLNGFIFILFVTALHEFDFAVEEIRKERRVMD